MVAVGKYEAKVIGYGDGKSSSGKDYVYMTFKVNGETVSWKGYLNTGKDPVATTQRTIDTLVLAGCRDLGAIAEGPGSNAFSDTTVSITVEHEQDQKDPAKMHAKVKWVNPLNSTKQKDAAQVAASKNVLAQYQGQFLASKQKLGVVTETKKSVGF